MAALLAVSGVFASDLQRSFVEATAQAKVNLPFWVAFARGVLANRLVCPAVWRSFRTTSDVAKLLMVFWCLFVFVGAGFEHSIANMTLLALALFQPHAETLTWIGYISNLIPVISVISSAGQFSSLAHIGCVRRCRSRGKSCGTGRCADSCDDHRSGGGAQPGRRTRDMNKLEELKNAKKRPGCPAGYPPLRRAWLGSHHPLLFTLFEI